MSNKPIFKKIDMTAVMKAADKGKPMLYETYRFSNGNAETYSDKIGGTPKFVKRG